MVVIGGNAVGLELGQLFARLGTRVTIVEVAGRLAPFDEPEISAPIEDVLGEESIGVRTGAKVRSAGRGTTGRSVHVRTAEERDLELACGEILVTGGPPYVYTAAAQGSAAAANALFGAERAVDYAALPRVTFTSPAIASAGLTEAELVRSGVACDCRVLPLGAVPRAVVSRDTRGVVKLVAEAGTGRIRGVHAVADGAGEMVTAGVYAIRAQMTVSGLAGTWAPYLTMSEALRLAAQSFSRDVTKLSCCAA
jgi:mercuric reductase